MRMRSSVKYIITPLLFLLSCGKHDESSGFTHQTLNITEAVGYEVPANLLSVPVEIPFSEPTSIAVRNPKVFPTNTHIQPAGIPRKITAGNPRIVTPGKDTFSMPQVFTVKDSTFTAGIPVVVTVKDPTLKDQNPLNFSSLSKLQGLKNSIVRCMLEDQHGNLWFGTNGGGVSKYDGKSFTHFTQTEGLSSGTLRSMHEDKNGNLWFGTDGRGVSKYDGKSFTHFTGNEAIAHLTVRAILEDKEGNMWFGTDNGVFKYTTSRDTSSATFTHFTIKEGLINPSVWAMLEDRSGNLWIGTEEGLVRYDGHSFAWYTTTEGLSDNGIISLLEDKKGNLWIGTYQGGFTIFDGNLVDGLEKGDPNDPQDQQDFLKINGNPIKSFTHYAEKEGLGNNSVWSMMEDKNGDIWFGTGTGASKFDGKSFAHFTEKEGFSNMEVFSMLEDKRGGIWLSASYRGILRYDGKIFTHFTEHEGLSHKVVYAALEDQRGDLWFATDQGGVSKYDGKSFTHFSKNEGLLINQVRSILEDRKGNLWLGTNGEGISRLSRHELKNTVTYSITNFAQKEGLIDGMIWCSLEDKNGNLWFGTNKGASKISIHEALGSTTYSCTNFTVKEGLIDNTIQDILQDKNGNIWFATDGGLTKYDGKAFVYFLRNEEVRSLLEDKNGILWLGTNKGLLKYDGKSFTRFTEDQGLINNYITSILEDNHGDLWIGTRLGLSKLSTSVLHSFSGDSNSISLRQEDILFTNYTYENGFLGIGCNTNAMMESKDGTIWIGTNDRLTAYHPEGEVTDTLPPTIQITGIELFNEPIAWAMLDQHHDSAITIGTGVKIKNYHFDGTSRWYGIPEKLSLAYNNNYIAISYNGITAKNHSKVKYKYKLDGNDEYWSTITSKTEAPYGNLASGRYTFNVKAMNSEGYWSETMRYPFTIRPPWWKTWWAYCLYGLLFVAAIRRIDIYLRQRAIRAEQEKAQRRELEQAKEIEKAYNQLETAHENLKSTQAQLIQSEKMASLGQLTAGIAHEIQNPLNFVNNFSEVNEELLAEMKDEMDKGNMDDAKAIANDAIENQQKILFHGKRADAIVKGMLQHSRSSSGVKEPTDINALADEYLRLAYHGLRAKDKSFNATMKTDFDETIGLINIIPQDIGRVILNLITNAFYAVSTLAPKSPKGDLTYVPTVIVTTKLLKSPLGDLGAKRVTISVRDNGPGIPQSVLDKIFQPFFTTKPTGQGTGLGLSLTYDIIKAHGGDITVTTNEGQGTEFIVRLPMT